jgi:hypothetical protein
MMPYSRQPYTANAADKAILEAEWTPAAQADHEREHGPLERGKQKEDGLNKIIKPEEELTHASRVCAGTVATACWA